MPLYCIQKLKVRNTYYEKFKTLRTRHLLYRIIRSSYCDHGTDIHSDAIRRTDDDADISILVYILLGAIGLPVFAGLSGGFQILIGPTGGFIISFPIMAWLIGIGVEKRKQKGMFVLFLILGTVINYVVGVIMFCALMQASVGTALAACVIPFIPTAIIKAVLAALLGLQIRDRLPASLQCA